jgi:hypothetical protein
MHFAAGDPQPFLAGLGRPDHGHPQRDRPEPVAVVGLVEGQHDAWDRHHTSASHGGDITYVL